MEGLILLAKHRRRGKDGWKRRLGGVVGRVVWWAKRYCIANLRVGSSTVGCMNPNIYGKMHTVQRPLSSKSRFSLARSTIALSGS